MIVLDKPAGRPSGSPEDRFTESEVAVGKIIDFEMARRALAARTVGRGSGEGEASVPPVRRTAAIRPGQPGQFSTAPLRTSPGGLLELLLTIAIILSIAVSILWAAIQGL